MLAHPPSCLSRSTLVDDADSCAAPKVREFFVQRFPSLCPRLRYAGEVKLKGLESIPERVNFRHYRAGIGKKESCTPFIIYNFVVY